ncbi:mechanosensitive protein [Bordetella trematum]|nr:mechanosensitive protein [Bordetella trematum]
MMIILIAVVLLAEPFGEAPVDLMQRLSRLYEGLQIGEINIRPGAVAQALLVLAVALLVVRLVKHWLAQRYLPTTELDPGMQTSAATLFGYAGAVLAVSLALSALGIGLERVAWIASALSVGIGFGLQAVVQNFVSGLILLAERPVKVGDWVSLGGIEGDIQRINVRATEIQMSDRSTVIVPNSEFITKTVRNVTHANPMGVVQIKLPMPLSSNAEQVRQIMLQAFVDQADILDTPEPQVYLDGIENGQLVFNARGYVSSPRNAYSVRSALLFTILKALSDADVAMAASNTLVLRNLPEPVSTPATS